MGNIEMKAVVDRKVYNTETAEYIGSFEPIYDPGDFHYYLEELYITKKGSFFIAGEGGPKSPYVERLGGGSYGGGGGIRPVSLSEAIEWLESTGNHEVLISDPRFTEQLEEA